MDRLGRLIAQKSVSRLIVVAVLLFTVLCAFLAGNVERDDDLLAFLPRDNPDIRTFEDLNREFGGLDVALVGIEAPDVMAPDFLRRLQAATKELSSLPNIDSVLSLTSVEDFRRDPVGGIISARLIEQIPETPEEIEALRARVLSRDRVVGNLISAEGDGVVIYAMGAHGAVAQEVASAVERVVRGHFPADPVFWGGSPFVSTYIYDTTQADVKRLTPWAVGAIVLIMMLAFRDWIGTLLGLGSTGIGILAAHAAMSVAGVSLNVVLSSMPIILFAVGSAYGIHILSRYYAYAREAPDAGEAVHRMVAHTAPVVLAAGFTTVFGLASFVTMDIGPLRIFGIFTALGILVNLGLSITFIPAVLRLAAPKPRTSASGPVTRAIVRVAVGIHRARRPVGVGLAVVLGLGLFFVSRVDSRVDQRAFYSPGSPPDLADAFLGAHFGGSLFIQILAEGDLSDPHVLREVQRLVDEVGLLPDVDRVAWVGEVVATVNDALEDQPRIPDTAQKVGAIFGLVTGNTALDRLVDPGHRRALMHVRLSTNELGEIEQTLAAVEALTAQAPRQLRLSQVGEPGAGDRLRGAVGLHLAALVREFDATGPETAAGWLPALDVAVPEPAAGEVAAQVAVFLQSEEVMVPVPAEQVSPLADALVALGPNPTEVQVGPAVAAVLGLPPDSPDLADLAWSVTTPLEEAWARARSRARAVAVLSQAGVRPPEGPRGDRYRAAVAATLLDLDDPVVAMPDPDGDQPLGFVVSGLPVMHRGLSESVRHNQIASLASALVLVVLVLSIHFRSPLAGLLASAPMIAALIVIYGGMGLLGIRLDIGTSMLASIVIGAGVDYAVHLLSSWYCAADEPIEKAVARAAARTGMAIWTNALMVAAGFFVLTLGDARPLQNVGGLTAAAMIAAALTTMLVLPVLGRRRRYSPHAPIFDPADAALNPPLRGAP